MNFFGFANCVGIATYFGFANDVGIATFAFAENVGIVTCFGFANNVGIMNCNRVSQTILVLKSQVSQTSWLRETKKFPILTKASILRRYGPPDSTSLVILGY